MARAAGGQDGAMTSPLRRAATGLVFAALIVAATSPSWRLLLPGASADEAILESLCGSRRGSALASARPPLAPTAREPATASGVR